MKHFLLLLVVLTLMPFSASAKDIHAERVSSRDAREIGFLSPQTAFDAIAGHTLSFSRMRGGGGKRGKDAFPFSGTVVGYFAPNGKVHIWAKEQEKVQGGRWFTGKSSDKKAGTLLCFDFPNNNEQNLCAVIKLFGKKIYYSAKGNVFNLRAGRAVPKVVSSHKKNLQDIADGVGM